MRGKKDTVTAKAKVSKKISNNKVQTKIASEITQEDKNIFGKLVFLLVVILGAFVGFQQQEINDLKQGNVTLKSDLERGVKRNIAQIKKVYVYNLEETLRGVKLESLNREFEEKLKILNDEVSIAQEKISTLNDTKDKDNFSDIYLQSLKLKRDTMLQEYNQTLEELTQQINQAVSQVAKEKNASVIFDIRAVASLTEDVEDVTDEVINKVKLMRPKTMSE